MSELEHWVRAAFGLDDDTDVRVSEQIDQTTRTGRTTVVEYPGRDGLQSHHLHLARADITPAHLWQLAAGDDHCCR